MFAHIHTPMQMLPRVTLYTPVSVFMFFLLEGDVAQAHIPNPFTGLECALAQSVTGVLHAGGVSCTPRAPLLGLAPPGMPCLGELG